MKISFKAARGIVVRYADRFTHPTSLQINTLLCQHRSEFRKAIHRTMMPIVAEEQEL
ncbi:hypothetical protein OAG75_01890 [bacterium]|nr:hypothetical protein [bacterium]